VVPSGSKARQLNPLAATALGLPRSCRLVAGTHRCQCRRAGCAAWRARRPHRSGHHAGAQTVRRPPDSGPWGERAPPGSRWLVGGAPTAVARITPVSSRSAAAELKPPESDPSRPSGLQLQPLPAGGERLPVRTIRSAAGAGSQACESGWPVLAGAAWRGWPRSRPKLHGCKAAGAPAIRAVIHPRWRARNPSGAD